jgi:uncharacterized protein Smg (DUF494 family)
MLPKSLGIFFEHICVISQQSNEVIIWQLRKINAQSIKVQRLASSLVMLWSNSNQQQRLKKQCERLQYEHLPEEQEIDK